MGEIGTEQHLIKGDDEVALSASVSRETSPLNSSVAAVLVPDPLDTQPPSVGLDASDIANARSTPSHPASDLLDSRDDTDDLSPGIASTAITPVSLTSMIDSSEFRSQLGPEPTYQTLNGRMSPSSVPYGAGCGSTYATLTPLQPLPPISTVTSDRYASPSNVSGSFTLMNNNTFGMGVTYQSYDLKSNLGMASMPTMTSMGSSSPYSNPYSPNGYSSQQTLGYSAYAYGGQGGHNGGISSPKPSDKLNGYEVAYNDYARTLSNNVTHSTRLHSPCPEPTITIINT